MDISNKTKLMATLLVSVILVAGGFFYKIQFVEFVKAANNQSSPTPTPVKVDQSGNTPRVELSVPVGSITAPENCTTKEEIERYGGSSEYSKRLARQATCVSGYMQATVFDGKIGDANSSASFIDGYYLDMLKKTSAKLVGIKTVDGLDIIAIPDGINSKNSLDNASGIAGKCLITNEGIKQNIMVGSQSNIDDEVYIPNNKKAAKVIAEIKKQLADYAKLSEKEKAKSDIGSAIEDRIKKELIIVDAKFVRPLDKKHLLDIGEAIEVTISLNGKTFEKKDLPLKYSLAKGPYKDSTLTIRDVAFKNIIIPEQYFLDGVRSVVDGRIKEMEKEKAKYEKREKDTRAELAKLHKKGYNCYPEDLIMNTKVNGMTGPLTNPVDSANKGSVSTKTGTDSFLSKLMSDIRQALFGTRVATPPGQGVVSSGNGITNSSSPVSVPTITASPIPSSSPSIKPAVIQKTSPASSIYSTPTPTPYRYLAPTPLSTPSPTPFLYYSTPTAYVSPTPSPASSYSPTPTPVAIITPTPSPTLVSTPILTPTPVSTLMSTPTPTPTPSSTLTSSPSASPVSSSLPSPTPSPSSSPSAFIIDQFNLSALIWKAIEVYFIIVR